MTYDVQTVRKDFPILDREVRPGVPLVYLDNAATSQKPQQVLDAMRDYYEQHNANVHRGIHTLAEEATALYEGARDKVSAFINAGDRAEVVFTKNSSEALNLLSYVLPLVLVHRVHADVAEIVDCGADTDRLGDRRCAGFVLVRRHRPGRAGHRDLVDHLAAAEKGR